MTRSLKIDLGQGDTLQLLEDFDTKGTSMLLYQRSPDHDPQTLVLPGKLLMELADRLEVRNLEEAGARLEKIPKPEVVPVPPSFCPCGSALHACASDCTQRLAPYLPCQVCLQCGLPRADRATPPKTPAPSEVKIPESKEEKTGEPEDWTCDKAACGLKNSGKTVYCPCGHSGNPNMTQTERYEEWRRREGVQPRIAFCPACGNVASPHQCPGDMF